MTTESKQDWESQLDRIEQLLRALHRDFGALKQKVADLERRLAFGHEEKERLR